VSAIAYLQLARAPALFTAISNIAAAHLVATQGAVRWPQLAALCLASCAMLAGGMILNDCFDFDVDLKERPSRPLPAGHVPRRNAWWLGGGCLALGVLAAAGVGLRSMVVAVALAGTIVLYDGAAKRSWLGPPVMGLCRYLNWILGLSVASLGVAAWLIPLPVLIYIFSVTVLSRAEVEAADSSLVAFTIGGMAASGAVIVFLWLDELLPNPVVLLLATVGLALVLLRLARVYRAFSSRAVQGAVGFLILGIIPLDATLAVGSGAWWGLLLLVLIAPGRWLGRWLYVT
jgi:4-hydroxybenzoate polyprenyltransferase